MNINLIYKVNFLNKLILVLITLNFQFNLTANVVGKGLGGDVSQARLGCQGQEGIGDEENILLASPKIYQNTSKRYVINGQTISEQELIGVVSVYTVLKLGASSLYNLCADCFKKCSYSRLEDN